MDSIKEYLLAHPAILAALIIFVVIIVLYFIFKQLIKVALVLLLIALAVAGYYYFQDPDKVSAKVKKSIETVKSGKDTVVEKGKSFYNDSKEIIDKTKEVSGGVGKFLKGAEEKKGE
ncbi:MAG TPA: hypothetical protein PK114_06300 [Smithellaceae bacterium]|nr:hypothetical protein [Smithellaceae bacterium]